jgi:hypothetical protein
VLDATSGGQRARGCAIGVAQLMQMPQRYLGRSSVRNSHSRAGSTWPSSFSSLPRHSCHSSPLLCSLVLLFPSLHSHRTLKTYIEPTETQLTTSRRRLTTNPCHDKPRHQCVHCSLSSDASPIADVSILAGTVWTHWEPAALRSSPAHPRSWQAPFPCPGRARKRQILYPTPLGFY